MLGSLSYLTFDISVFMTQAQVWDYSPPRLEYVALSYDVASGSEITPCNKINKPLMFYRFLGNVIMSITTLRT